MGRTNIEFQQFHDAYGKAYGAKIDRIAAERAWKRLSDKDKRAAIAGITAYRDYCQDKGVAMAYPGKYLNLHRWEVEVVEPAGTKTELSAKPRAEAQAGLRYAEASGKSDAVQLPPDAKATGTGTKPALADMETW